MWLKRLVRPLIPDRLMARYRLHQHSKQVRANVDILVPTQRDRRRWLASTPDTYRVGLMPSEMLPPGGFTVYGDESAGWLAAIAAEHTGADAGVVGRTPAPRLVGRRRIEPAVDPIAVAVRPGVEAAEVGVDDLVGLHRALKEHGHRTALVPRIDEAVEERRSDPIPRPLVVVLAAVPIHDIGGGSRGSRITVELLRRGFHVVYVAMFGTHESVDLGLRFIHPHLEQYRYDELPVAVLGSRALEPAFVLVEIPHRGYADAVQRLFGDWRVVYDVIDRWDDPALGGDWYRPDIDEGLLAAADALVASSPDLARWAGRRGGEVALVPNAVDGGVFGRAPGPTPADFPPGTGPVLGYHGSLYGDWFDWQAIRSLAIHRPEARVVLIGDPGSAPGDLPGNVHLLGLKPQQELPAYLALFDVGLVPFVVTETTHAVSPLKAYEYLAMGVPVAAAPLRALEGLDGVHTADRLETAVRTAEAADPPDRDTALREHTWSQRVDRLLSIVHAETPSRPGQEPRVVVRPAVHHERTERAI